MSEWIDCPKCGRNHENMTACIYDEKQPEEEKQEQRRGATGVWTFVLKNPESGHIVARAEWGKNYNFAAKEWEALPIV